MPHKPPELMTITEICLREQIGYTLGRDRVLRGQYGEPVRIGGRLFVRPTAAAAK